VTTAAIWGATGFIGSALSERAQAGGRTVFRLPRRLRDAGQLKSCDVVYHCAGKVAEPDPQGYADDAENLARLCIAAGARRLIYLSTVAVYGPRFSGDIAISEPVRGIDDYARCRIAAEERLAATLAGSATRLAVVRVPTIVGRSMPGTILGRFAGVVRWGLFPHPGTEEATLACLGISRLTALLLRLGELPAPPPVVQFSDHLRWSAIARRIGEIHGRRVLRVRLPVMGGKLAVLGSTVRYQDDSARLFGDQEFPLTETDLDDALVVREFAA
jgi:nucleoside-diphosphate-sugar epimerase